MKKLIVVLGMHRSGTSAVIKALSCLGVSLGDDFMPAGKDNPKGFFEDKDINQLNIEMLGAIGQHWFSLSLVTESDLEKLVTLGYLERAIELLTKKMAEVPAFGFKDPRVSKLFKFWRMVFSRIDCDVRYVFCLRHPLSVARSLRERNSTPIHKGYLLWLSYNLAIVAEAQNLSLIGLDYDQLMEQPLVALQQLAERLELNVDLHASNQFATEFLDQTLRHSRFDETVIQRDSECPLAVAETYPILQQFLGIDSQRARAGLMNFYLTNVEKITADFQLFDDVEKAAIEYFYVETNARELAQQLQTCVNWAKSLEQEAEQRAQWARALEQQVEERTQWAKTLEQQAEERARWVESLEQKMEERTLWAK
ncbi:MAG TPA: hypothetical protein DIW64_13940, partial [Cellvibrio sp.]|nr:hypothetical protein [Cellvibrio sp.]